MIISRFSVALLTSLASASLAAAAQMKGQPFEHDCSNIDPFAERACVDKRVAAKKRLLQVTYSRALRSVKKNFAHYGGWDSRSDPVYLTRSQSAWKQYVENDCKVQAAFGGGSNSSISDREMECYEDALDKRLELLRQLADGTFGTG